MSTATSPVTHTAEVAVNNVSTSPVRWPDSVASGSDNSAVPTAIAEAKPATTTCAGCRHRSVPSLLRTIAWTPHSTDGTAVQVRSYPLAAPRAAALPPIFARS